jgi:uncharacterized secreted protein with C-terminal beta-propeller domain
METITKVLLLLCVTLLLAYSTDSGVGKLATNDAAKIPARLVRAYSSDTLVTQFKASLLKQYGQFDEDARSDFMLASEGTEIAQDINSSFSTTTLQEDTVDESDRIKTHGKYIYASSLKAPTIKVFQTNTGDKPQVNEVSIKTQNNETLISGLYLRSKTKQLIALTSEGLPDNQAMSAWFNKEHWSNRKTEVIDLDLSDPSSPKYLGKLTLDGQVISSRRIANVLYLATRQTVTIPELISQPVNDGEAAYNRRVIENISMKDLLPQHEINGKRAPLFNFNDCFYAANQGSNHSQQSVISLLAIDLDSVNSTPKGQCYIGDAETIYSSAEAIYLASTPNPYSDDFSDVVYEASATTEIHKFSLDGLQTDYVGSTTIEGHLGWNQNQKSFRMSEKDGFLRVLSYVGEQANSFESPARLHILKTDSNAKALETIAVLPNESHPQPLGKKGELIYGSRFVGDRGYLVTFRTTDPLYILDLADPYNPYILSALEIDGYSDYLQPVGENYLLGIGKDAVAQLPDDPFESPNGAWYQGVKLSLIDISDPTAPIEKETIILGKRGTETAVSKSHKALTTLMKGDTLQINLPISLHETVVENYGFDKHPSDYFGWTEDALYRFNIDTANGEISALKPVIATMKDVPETAEYYFDTAWQHDRSVIIGDHAYYLKRDELFSSAY